MSTNVRRGKSAGARRPTNIVALARGIAVLRCFQSAAGALSHGEISRLTGVSKPTVTRLVATLMAEGFIRRVHGSDRYALSAGVLWLAGAFLSGLDIRAIARPHMEELAERTGTSVYLGLPDGLEVALIETCRSRSTMLFSRLDVGSRVPMPTSSLGRAYLTALADGERGLLIEKLRRACPAEWPRAAGGIERAMRDTARFGYCLSLGEMHPEIMSVAVPLRSARGDLLAIACAGPASSFDERSLRSKVAPRLAETAHAIGREIGDSVSAFARGGGSDRPAARQSRRPRTRRPAPAYRKGGHDESARRSSRASPATVPTEGVNT